MEWESALNAKAHSSVFFLHALYNDTFSAIIRYYLHLRDFTVSDTALNGCLVGRMKLEVDIPLFGPRRNQPDFRSIVLQQHALQGNHGY